MIESVKRYKVRGNWDNDYSINLAVLASDHDAAIAALQAELAKAKEDCAQVRWIECEFRGPPPDFFEDWFTWARSRNYYGVVVMRWDYAPERAAMAPK